MRLVGPGCPITTVRWCAEVTDAASDMGIALAPIAAAAAVGDPAALARHLDAAFEGGVPVDPVRETILMLAPFGGFPRTLDALVELRAARVRAGLADSAVVRESGERTEHPSRGRALFGRVYGPNADRIDAKLRELDGELPDWVLEDAYGRVLSRPGLSEAHRERIAVVFLCALGLSNQLSGHVRGALRCGATAEEIERSLTAAEPLLAGGLVADARRVIARAVESAE